LGFYFSLYFGRPIVGDVKRYTIKALLGLHFAINFTEKPSDGDAGLYPLTLYLNSLCICDTRLLLHWRGGSGVGKGGTKMTTKGGHHPHLVHYGVSAISWVFFLVLICLFR
jgi:hypothetical protein